MVPLAQMRTLIFLLACGALAEKTRSNTTSLLPQPPGPRQGDPDRHGIGDSPPDGCSPGVAPKCTAVIRYERCTLRGSAVGRGCMVRVMNARMTGRIVCTTTGECLTLSPPGCLIRCVVGSSHEGLRGCVVQGTAGV